MGLGREATLASKEKVSRNAQSGKGGFDGRDLLVGRPERGQGRPAAGTAESAAGAKSPQLVSPDDATAKILTTVKALSARIDALLEAPAPEYETAGALARETAALTQAVGDARAVLADAAELAAGRDGAAEAARVLAQGVAMLKAQGEALDQRLHATGQQANQTGWQAETVAQGIKEVMPTVEALRSSLRIHTENMSRTNRNQRWRPWLKGLAIGAASFVFFALGAVLQREAGVMSFGDPRHEWNDFVAEHYAPTLAACASEARTGNVIIGCRILIPPSLAVIIPLYPDITLTDVPPEEQGDTAAGG